MPHEPVDLELFKQALTDTRRKMFTSAMSNRSAEQLQTLWGIYADFEKEKDAIASARVDPATRYVESFGATTGLADADIAELVREMAALQNKNVDLLAVAIRAAPKLQVHRLPEHGQRGAAVGELPAGGCVAASRIPESHDTARRGAAGANPFGDGRAAERIVAGCVSFLDRGKGGNRISSAEP